MKKIFMKGLVPFFVALFVAGCSSEGNDGPDLPPLDLKNAYIDRVYDYLPGVGQFTNKLPEYEEGDTKADLIRKAELMIKGSKPEGMISLGGFGGYVVFGFPKRVPNVEGYRDFRVLGNAFWANANPNPNASSRGGSCEPGVIWVSKDVNGNGEPDDAWYEIRGSEYTKSVHGYKITYHRPDPKKKPVLDPKRPYATDVEYIFWEDNQGNKGYKEKNQFHGQSYFPAWITGNSYTLEGTLLPNNAVDESGEGKYWVLYSFDYGYADNAPNEDDESAIDISWAVDAQGKPVHLDGIDFVKVVCGMNQEAGWLGETSTEVQGAVNLHALGKRIKTRNLR